MGRSRIKDERLTDEVIAAIERVSFGSRSAYWRRYLGETEVSLADFSAAMRGDKVTGDTVRLVVGSLVPASLDWPFRGLLLRECPACKADVTDAGPVVVDFTDEGDVVRRVAGDYDMSRPTVRLVP